jgi:hypothetical protein
MLPTPAFAAPSPLVASIGAAATFSGCRVRPARTPVTPVATQIRMVAVDPTTIIDTVYDPNLPDTRGRFGRFGGRYVPETLMGSLEELEAGYDKIKDDPEFKAELDGLLKDFVGRATPLYFAERLSKRFARPDGTGPKIYLKVWGSLPSSISEFCFPRPCSKIPWSLLRFAGALQSRTIVSTFPDVRNGPQLTVSFLLNLPTCCLDSPRPHSVKTSTTPARIR